LGERVGLIAAPGTVIAFRGGLGAGKTTFTKGIAAGLGIRDEVTSPTYTIVAEYDGRIPLYHIDAYRLASPADFEDVDASRYLFGDGLCVVEWSENVAGAIPETACTIEIVPGEGDSRTIVVSGGGIEGGLA